ncbi:hypothetical protein AKJ16_DCAP13593 [Drosera capensis]
MIKDSISSTLPPRISGDGDGGSIKLRRNPETKAKRILPRCDTLSGRIPVITIRRTRIADDLSLKPCPTPTH